MAEHLDKLPIHIRFQLTRAEAIDLYAHLEQELLNLFDVLLRSHSPGSAWTIFTRILNSDSRNNIIQELLIDRFGEDCKEFAVSLFEHIRRADGIRNKVVHFHLMFRGDAIPLTPPREEHLTKPFLTHPNQIRPGGSEINHADLLDFCQRLRHITGIVNELTWAIRNSEMPDDIRAQNRITQMHKTLPEIFATRVTYPPE